MANRNLLTVRVSVREEDQEHFNQHDLKPAQIIRMVNGIEAAGRDELGII